MASLSLSVDGLLGRWDWSSAGSWSIGTGFTRTADPALITFGKLPTALLTPGVSDDSQGCREGLPFIDQRGFWYIIYDSGNGTTGWRQFIARSKNQGVSWERKAFSIGLDNGSGGSYAAVATGALIQIGSSFYLHRVTATNSFGSPNTGLPNVPFHWDIWSSPDLWNGPWTFVRTVPVGANLWCNNENLPCWVVKVGAMYHMYAQGSGSGYAVGYGVASAPDGAPVMQSSAALDSSNFFGFAAENLKMLEHTQLGVWFGLVNLIDPAGTYTGRNGISVSASHTLNAATTYCSQSYLAPCDTTGHAIGVQTHFTGPQGVVVNDDGYIPFVYDSDPANYTPGWHIDRSIFGAVHEPASHCLLFNDTSGTRRESSLALTNSDFQIKAAFYLPADPTSGSDISYEYRRTGANGYRFRLPKDGTNKPIFEKLDGTLIASGSGTAAILAGVVNRVVIDVSGSSHKLTLNGEVQINTTDASFASGTSIAVTGKNCICKVWPMTMTRSGTLSFTGLSPGGTYWLRTKGRLPIASVVADGSGNASYVCPPLPVGYLQVGNSNLTLENGMLYSGSTIALSQTGGPTRAGLI